MNSRLAGLVKIDEFFMDQVQLANVVVVQKQKKLIITVFVWKDRDGKERPGFAHAIVASDDFAKTIGTILRCLAVLKDEITPLINAIQTDSWQRHKAVVKQFGFVHHRVIFSDQRDY